MSSLSSQLQIINKFHCIGLRPLQLYNLLTIFFYNPLTYKMVRCN